MVFRLPCEDLLRSSIGNSLRCAETAGLFAPQKRKPPLCKGRWLAEGETEGLSISLPDLFFLQNDSITIPHPLTRELPLHKGAFIMFALRGRPQDSFHEPWGLLLFCHANFLAGSNYFTDSTVLPPIGRQP